MNSPDLHQKCGFVSVIGLPNAGKSTLVNALVGAKVSIVSRKAQTTRRRILGIVMHEGAQLILIDTPGIFTPKRSLDKAMVKAARESMPESDAVLHIVDAARRNALDNNKAIIRQLPSDKPCFLVLNKIDRVAKPELLAQAQAFNDEKPYTQTIMISALKEDGLARLKEDLAALIPAQPYHYDPDQLTDLPMRLMAAEITREKIYDQLHQELPYDSFVVTENWREKEDGSVHIDQAIIVARSSQKGIVLGRKGARIKTIGQAARQEMKESFGQEVHLKLFVKIDEGWAERPDTFGYLGL